MKKIIYSTLFLGILMIQACQKDIVFPEDKYYNTLSFPDSSLIHPKATAYQSLLDNFIDNGGIGTSIMIRDAHGTWLGAGGYADIASDISIQTGNQFLIASVSKVFTATAIFSFIDEGKLSLDDPVNKWIDKSITDNIDNANESTVKHLLGHTSGIRDIYNIDHLMEYMNRQDHNWSDEDMLKFIYGKEAYVEVGESWQYSNINYILLGMILENVSGLSLKEVYAQKIFNPLGLESAYYGTGEMAAPAGLVKGYTDMNSNNSFVEADEFYEDDIGMGGDGGIAINAQDLGRFTDALMKGNIISQNSLDEMQNWFEGGYSSDGKAGYGQYYFEETQGIAYGHDGGIIGWEANIIYFPDDDVTMVRMFNADLILTTSEYDDNFNEFSIALKKAIFED